MGINSKNVCKSFNNKFGNICMAPPRKRMEQKPEVEAEAPILLTEIYRPIIDRTYEKPMNWYYLTFKPLNKPYNLDRDWFANKGIEKVKDKLRGSETFVLTRETLAEKIHINALVCSKKDLTKLHEKVCYHKYKIHCQKLYSASDRRNVLNYMCKEINQRKFEKYLDYLYYFPKDFQFITR